MVFGRVVLTSSAGEAIATKIALELASEGALKGTIIRAYATAVEEDNDGAGPMFVQKVLPGQNRIDSRCRDPHRRYRDSPKGALGIYRGQRGRMQIELTVTGRSCHECLGKV